MTRISSLLFATGLAILPISAFAQQTVAPANMTMAQPATSTATMTKTEAKAPSTGVKTTASTKDAKSTHTKLGNTTPAVPAKTTEPGKS